LNVVVAPSPIQAAAACAENCRASAPSRLHGLQAISRYLPLCLRSLITLPIVPLWRSAASIWYRGYHTPWGEAWTSPAPYTRLPARYNEIQRNAPIKEGPRGMPSTGGCDALAVGLELVKSW
jgi:hypothetical protein